jgi:sec-independent protein translocase protein TatB
MFGVGFLELLIIGVFAVVFVGPKRLPEVMRQAGRLFVHLRRTANDVRSTFDQVIREAENEMHREEADALRKALKPMQDAHQEVKSLLTGTTAATAATAAPTPAGVQTPISDYPPTLQTPNLAATVDRAEATHSTPPGSIPYTLGGAPAAAPPAEAVPKAPASEPSGDPKATV